MVGPLEAGVEGRTGKATFKGVWGSDLQGGGYGVFGSTTSGAGVAGTSPTGSAVNGSTFGTGRAGNFFINNAANANAALTGATDGSGAGVEARNSAAGPPLIASNGSGEVFRVGNTGNVTASGRI